MNNCKRWGFIGIVGWCVMVSGLASVSAASTALVKVNDDIITQEEIDFLVNSLFLPQFAAQNPGKQFPAEEKKKVEQTILDQLITERLIIQIGRQQQIHEDQNLLEQQMQTLKAQFPNASADGLREFLRQKLLVQAVIQAQVVSKIAISDQELKQFYDQQKDQFNEPEQVRASHILVKVAPDASPDQKDTARKKIEYVLTQARAGNDFAELAKQYSECPTNTKGGDLGFFVRNVMVAPFDNAAFSLKEGEISNVVETEFGYHIIKLTGKKSQRIVTFDEAKERLRQDFLREKTNIEVNKWISTLRTNAKIEYVGFSPVLPK